MDLNAIAVLLTPALIWVGQELAKEGLKPGAAQLLKPLTNWLDSREARHQAQDSLQSAFTRAVEAAGIPLEDENKARAYARRGGLEKLQLEPMDALRRQLARAVVGFTDPGANPPEDLLLAFGWQPERADELRRLLVNLRQNLAQTKEWAPLVENANDLAQRDLLAGILGRLDILESTLVLTPEGDALRVVVIQAGLSELQAEEIERSYRFSLAEEFKTLETTGLSPAQLPKAICLPLKDVYLELEMLPIRTEEERRQEEEQMLHPGETERLQRETQRTEQRVSDFLSSHQRLVIVGKPGSGKTVSLKYIALMLASGSPGMSRLGMDRLYIPLYLRLGQYAQRLKTHSSLSLEAFLESYIKDYYTDVPRQNEFLQFALQKGDCLLLLDGLDEVGDIGDSLLGGKTLREQVLEQVKRFARRRCNESIGNRLVVTSRLEGYRTGELPGFAEFELGPLHLPEEVQDFLLRWFTAYEMEYRQAASYESALQRAKIRNISLMEDIMLSQSVQRLAMNPLLLTILAMIHEKGTRLPHQRVDLYRTVADTMIENWRIAQTQHESAIYRLLPISKIRQLLISLAYWLHENKPGGAMPEDEWRREVKERLTADEEEGEWSEDELNELVEAFLHHARQEVGILTERSLGQIGFFHLTLEEYLAAVEIASYEGKERNQRVEKHWSDPYWEEVLLLTAGQLMLNNSKGLELYIYELRNQESVKEPLAGRGPYLAGRALLDVGTDNFKRKVVRDVRDDLVEVMQDLDPETQLPHQFARVPLATRAAAAEVLDELEWLPPDLHRFVRLPGKRVWIARYPVTNAQYARFLQPENFADRSLWLNLPKFNEHSQRMDETWGEDGWHWLQGKLDEDGVLLPRYWRDPRFGASRRGVPVVGITWWEANAYCRWLLRNWGELDEGRDRANPTPGEIRLPTDDEWVAAAGGDKPEKRFPWDQPDQVTEAESEIMRRANVWESGISRTTPVGMYPLGVSAPGGSGGEVWDLAGNTWEWLASYRNADHDWLRLRGGSWGNNGRDARLDAWGSYLPYGEWDHFGFRVVALPS